MSLMSAAYTASRALSLGKYLYGLLNVELKHNDTATNGTLANTGTMTCLTAFAEGSDNTARDGRKVLLKSVFCRGHVTVNTAGSAGQLCRIIIFKDKIGYGATPTITNLLMSDDVDALLNPDYAGEKFEIYYDKILHLNPAGTESRPIYFYKKLFHHISWTGTTNSVSYALSGHLWVYFVGNVGTNQPTITFNTRVQYIDN